MKGKKAYKHIHPEIVTMFKHSRRERYRMSGKFYFILFPLCSVSHQKKHRQNCNSASLHCGENHCVPGKGDKIAETCPRRMTLVLYFLQRTGKVGLFSFQIHIKNLQKRKTKIQQIKKKAAKKALENAQLEEDIADMQSVIQESRIRWKATGNKPLSAPLKCIAEHRVYCV